jgi:hydrogenase maturation factor
MDSFTAADQTGGTEIKRWINVDAVNQDDFQEGDYVVVTGAVKQFGQKVSIIAVG